MATATSMLIPNMTLTYGDMASGTSISTSIVALICRGSLCPAANGGFVLAISTSTLSSHVVLVFSTTLRRVNGSENGNVS
jgi:hypothetical protein